MEVTLENIKITVSEKISEQEILNYIDYLQRKNPRRRIATIDLTIDGDFVEGDYTLVPVPFVRLRRVTGYLSKLPKFNNAKRSEERDRTKHNY